jgi:hypothetical protein
MMAEERWWRHQAPLRRCARPPKGERATVKGLCSGALCALPDDGALSILRSDGSVDGEESARKVPCSPSVFFLSQIGLHLDRIGSFPSMLVLAETLIEG